MSGKGIKITETDLVLAYKNSMEKNGSRHMIFPHQVVLLEHGDSK